MPGVAFDLSDPKRVRPLLTNVRRLVGVVTYGRPRHMVWWMANPSKRIVTRYLRWLTGGARTEFHVLYHMNVASKPPVTASPPGFALPCRVSRRP